MNSSRNDNPTDLIFYRPIDDLKIRDLAGASAAIAVCADYLKDRRSRIAKRLREMIEDGDLDGHSIDRRGKSDHVDLGESITLRRTESGGGRQVNRKKLLDLLRDHEVDHDRVMQPTGWAVDMEKLDAALKEHGIEKESVMKPTGWDVDESLLKALVTIGALTDEELESVYEDAKPRVSVTVAFDKDTKELYLERLKAMEGTLVDEGTADSDA